jgi:hypothetical protein
MDLKSFLSTVNQDSATALTVPLPVHEDDSVIIGYDRPQTGAGYITLPLSELKPAAGLLYTGQHFPVVVHGLKRLREVYRLPDVEIDPLSVWDTRLMAHLLDPSRDDDHGYRLSALVQEHLNQDYPYMGEILFAQDYSEFLRRCVNSSVGSPVI